MNNIFKKSMKARRRRRRRAVFAILLLVLVCTTVYSNTKIEVTEIVIDDESIPVAFTGFKIVQLSDLHNIEFGNENSRLISKIKDASPDIIVITGDIVDMTNTDFDIALKLVKNLTELCPVYYVTGNHEGVVDNYFSFENDLIGLGVNILANTGITTEKNGAKLEIIGVDDPTIYRKDKQSISDVLKEHSEAGDYRILLSHRPELFDEYVASGVDLVFAGHAHGGQFRLPFIGGVYAPNQGAFPKYDGGMYTKEGTKMIVSRGLGNSVIPIRFNNCPEIVVVELVPTIEEGEILYGT
jgi:predicted MPP superfamily phosphohydrolase